MERQAQTLLGLGALLFFLGLLSGSAIPAMTNSRMGLSGHLGAVMNGTFVIAIGLAWSRLHLSQTLRTLTYWTLLYGAFANWLFVHQAAMFGTSVMTPIAGSGHEGLPWQENLVSLGLFSVAIALAVAGGLLVWGFFGTSDESN